MAITFLINILYTPFTFITFVQHFKYLFASDFFLLSMRSNLIFEKRSVLEIQIFSNAVPVRTNQVRGDT